MRHQTAIFFFLISGILSVAGQGLTDSTATNETLYLNFRNINFIRNNEYSNPIIEGYTLIGYFVQPELVYHASDRVTLRAGAHLLSYSGTNKFTIVKPLFSTEYNFSERSSLRIGSLSGSDGHRMSDPHFNKERLYSSNSEDGLQFRFLGDHLFNDTWLSWENYIFRGDMEREVFTAGESFRYSSPPIHGFLEIEIPLQLQLKHFGGQISDYPQGVETWMNLSGGARLNIDIYRKKYGTAGVEYLAFMGKSMTRNSPNGIETGYGQWYKLFYTYRRALFEAGFWDSHDFYAPNGNFIFSSVSDHLENVRITDRKIITGSLNVTILPESFLEIYFGFDGYYDIDLKRFDNAVTLHLRFDKLFKIADLKQNTARVLTSSTPRHN
jgi:hypothetical protein